MRRSTPRPDSGAGGFLRPPPLHFPSPYSNTTTVTSRRPQSIACWCVGKKTFEPSALDGAAAVEDLDGLAVVVAGDAEAGAEGEQAGVGGDENAAVGGHGPAAGGEAAGVGAAALGARAVGRHVHPDRAHLAQDGGRFGRSSRRGRLGGRHVIQQLGRRGRRLGRHRRSPNHERGRLGPGRFGAFDGVKGGGGGRSGAHSGDGVGLRPGRTTRHRRGDPVRRARRRPVLRRSRRGRPEQARRQ